MTLKSESMKEKCIFVDDIMNGKIRKGYYIIISCKCVDIGAKNL